MTGSEAWDRLGSTSAASPTVALMSRRANGKSGPPSRAYGRPEGRSCGGIVLLDGAMFGAAAPTGNSIRLNWLSGNMPNDIYGDGTGTLNTVSGNTCTTTSLVGAC